MGRWQSSKQQCADQSAGIRRRAGCRVITSYSIHYTKLYDVDESSLTRYGQWPWPRHLVARLLSIVRDGKPDAVGVDILFAEPDRSSLIFVNKNLKDGFGTDVITSYSIHYTKLYEDNPNRKGVAGNDRV